MGLGFSLLTLGWFYDDAIKRDMNGLLWVILIIITGYVGMVLYFKKRGNKKNKTNTYKTKKLGINCVSHLKEIHIDPKTFGQHIR